MCLLESIFHFFFVFFISVIYLNSEGLKGNPGMVKLKWEGSTIKVIAHDVEVNIWQ